MVAWAASDLMGLTPGIDPRRSDKFFALGGQNYAFDSIGPRSIFGNRFVTPYPLGRPEHVQGIRLKVRGGDRVFTFTGDSILEWREDRGCYRVIYVTPNTTSQPYRWTYGYLNGFVYFCHPATGILVYDVTRDVCYRMESEGHPSAAIAICVNNGRLCAIDNDYFYFSESSDGNSWKPGLGLAGFVRISDRVSGDPIMMTAYTKGVLVWTTSGILKCAFTADQVVFRFSTINTEYRPVNSFCTCRLDDDTAVILDERGLFQSKGEVPTPFSPLFNEFLIEYMKQNRLTVGQNVRIEWDELQRLLYVSVSLSYESALYEMAFVLYPPMDKWGQFNEAHYGILPVRFDAGGRSGNYYGFADSAGRHRYWRAVASREGLPDDTGLDASYPASQKPTHPAADGLATVLSASARVSTVPAFGRVGVAGYYRVDGSINAPPTLVGLSASIQLGLLRFNADAADRMSEVTQLIVGNYVVGDTTIQAGAFNLTPLLAEPNFGLQEVNYVNHGLKLYGTADGVSMFDSTQPDLTLVQRGARHYACSVVGVWHIVELTATAVGEAFHLQSLDLTAVDAGRIA